MVNESVSRDTTRTHVGLSPRRISYYYKDAISHIRTNTLAYPASLVYTLRESILRTSCGSILSTAQHLQRTIMMVHYETGEL